MISDLLGITALAIVASVVTFLVRLWPALRNTLWTAFTLRAGAALFHYFILPLPDTGADAIAFERLAWRWAQGGFGEVWSNFSGPDPYFISWIIALLYSITERSLLLAQSLSVLMGVGTVFIAWLLARDLWGEYAAMKAGWILTFFPTLILYSAIPLREAYIWFFLSMGLLGVVRWVRVGGFGSISLLTFGFVMATFFHGAMITGLFAFVGVFLCLAIKRAFVGLIHLKARVSPIVMILLLMVPVGAFLTDRISVSYLGDFSQLSDLEGIITRLDYYTRSTDNAAYPEWTVPSSLGQFLYKGPIRIAYFLYSPFPWDIANISHLIGMLDSFFYCALTFFIWRNRKSVWSDPAGRLLLIILLAYLFVFGLAVGNFGTGIRHRTKFVGILIILVAPLLPRIRLICFTSRPKD